MAYTVKRIGEFSQCLKGIQDSLTRQQLSPQESDIRRAIGLAHSLEDGSMVKKVKVPELPDFDASEYLGSDEDIAACAAKTCRPDSAGAAT